MLADVCAHRSHLRRQLQRLLRRQRRHQRRRRRLTTLTVRWRRALRLAERRRRRLRIKFGKSFVLLAATATAMRAEEIHAEFQNWQRSSCIIFLLFAVVVVVAQHVRA